jgi:tetratricopeptide (TPR) repeat protein
LSTDTLQTLRDAMEASQRGDTALALRLLEDLHGRTPDARAAYLLGAEHAQAGAYEAAEAYWREAVRLDPALDTAHLQLGLLLLTQGRVEASMAALRGLDGLAPEHPVQCFRQGLQHLARDEFQPCLAALARGIEANAGNAALNNDMQRLALQVQQHLAQMKAQAPVGADATADAAAGHVLLSAYRGDAGGPVRH